MLNKIDKTKKYRQIKPFVVEDEIMINNNVKFHIARETPNYIFCAPEGFNYCDCVKRKEFHDYYEVIEDDKEKTKPTINKDMKYRQIKEIKIRGLNNFNFDYIGEEFKIIEVENNIIVIDLYGTYLAINENIFYDYFETTEETKINELKSEFEVGDMVKITNKYNHENSTAGASYSYYPSFFTKNDFYELKSRYVEKGVKNGIYKIVGIGRHSLYPNPIVYVLKKDNKIYLMSNTYNEMEKVNNNKKEKNIMTQSQTNNQHNKLQTHGNLYARLGDTIILSNGLKLKVCKDFSDGDIQYYKTVDISCNTNVTIGYSEDDIKKFCIGKKVWGYGVDEFEIVDIERKQIKVKKVKVEQNKIVNSDKTVYTYTSFPRTVYWEIKNNKTGKIINENVTVKGELFKLIIDGDRTTVIFNDGSKGTTKCLPTDKYDFKKGEDIAYLKALVKSIENRIEELVK